MRLHRSAPRRRPGPPPPPNGARSHRPASVPGSGGRRARAFERQGYVVNLLSVSESFATRMGISDASRNHELYFPKQDLNGSVSERRCIFNEKLAKRRDTRTPREINATSGLAASVAVPAHPCPEIVQNRPRADPQGSACIQQNQSVRGAIPSCGMKMVPRGGIEPPTRGFSIRCSTN